MTDARFTHRPAPFAHHGPLEALVYLRQNCSVHPLPTSGVVRIGRGADNDIRIDDQSVSRNHLALYLGADIEVEDLGSANGTRLFRIEQDDSEDAPTRPNEEEARLHRGERRVLEPGGFVRAGIALVMI
ncbi:MAG TPA: FHA domain-containing protein, partial [Polyangiaceae bacterium]